jgi:hypothetical protein
MVPDLIAVAATQPLGQGAHIVIGVECLLVDWRRRGVLAAVAEHGLVAGRQVDEACRDAAGPRLRQRDVFGAVRAERKGADRAAAVAVGDRHDRDRRPRPGVDERGDQRIEVARPLDEDRRRGQLLDQRGEVEGAGRTVMPDRRDMNAARIV